MTGLPLIVVVGIALGALTLFVVRSLVRPQLIGSVVRDFQAGRIQNAIRLAKRILEGNSSNVDARYYLALAYLKERKPDLALVELRRVGKLGEFTTLCPEVPYRLQIATLYKESGLPDEALKEYLLALQKEPGNAAHHYSVGLLFEERDNRERAKGFYLKAAELDPNHVPARVGLGVLLFRGKQYKESQKVLEEAVEKTPNDLKAHFYLGRTLKRQERTTNALCATWRLPARVPSTGW